MENKEKQFKERAWCWKYKLSMLFMKNKYYIPMCCVGCKYAKNNRCTKGERK